MFLLHSAVKKSVLIIIKLFLILWHRYKFLNSYNHDKYLCKQKTHRPHLSLEEDLEKQMFADAMAVVQAKQLSSLKTYHDPYLIKSTQIYYCAMFV